MTCQLVGLSDETFRPREPLAELETRRLAGGERTKIGKLGDDYQAEARIPAQERWQSEPILGGALFINGNDPAAADTLLALDDHRHDLANSNVGARRDQRLDERVTPAAAASWTRG